MSEKRVPEGVTVDSTMWEECETHEEWNRTKGGIIIGQGTALRYFRRRPQPGQAPGFERGQAAGKEGLEVPGLEGKWEYLHSMDYGDAHSQGMNVTGQYVPDGYAQIRVGSMVYIYRRIPDSAPEPVNWHTADWCTCAVYLTDRGILAKGQADVAPSWRVFFLLLHGMRKRGYTDMHHIWTDGDQLEWAFSKDGPPHVAYGVPGEDVRLAARAACMALAAEQGAE